MPQVDGERFEVDAEEERYLRSAFRRFALPYVAASVIALGASLALVAPAAFEAPAAPPPNRDADAREAIEALRADTEALRVDVAAALTRLDAVDERLGGASRRVSELERQVERANRRSEEAGERQMAARAAGEAAQTFLTRLDALEGRFERIEARLAVQGSAADPAAVDPPGSTAPPAAVGPEPSPLR